MLLPLKVCCRDYLANLGHSCQATQFDLQIAGVVVGQQHLRSRGSAIGIKVELPCGLPAGPLGLCRANINDFLGPEKVIPSGSFPVRRLRARLSAASTAASPVSHSAVTNWPAP